MPTVDILSEEFAQAAANAGREARRRALAAGHPVIFVDEIGRFVEELPDGTRFEIRFQPDAPRESHVQIVREIATPGK